MSTIYGNQPYQQSYQPNQYGYQSQPYQSMQQPYMRYNPQPNSNIEYVNGVESVKAMPLPPNCIRLYLDSELTQFYIKRTDAEGRATVQVYQYTDTSKEAKPEYVTIEQFNGLQAEFQEFKKLVGEKSV